MYFLGRDLNMKQDIVQKTTFVDVLGIGHTCHTCHTDTRKTTREGREAAINALLAEEAIGG
jgi:hypothetical protein